MALTNCPDCSRPVSDQATICLNCGRPIKQSLPSKLAAQTKSTANSLVQDCKEIVPIAQKTFSWLFATFAISGLTFVFVLLLKDSGDLPAETKVIVSVFLTAFLFLFYYSLVDSTKESRFSPWSTAVISLSIIKIAFALPSAFALPTEKPIVKPIKSPSVSSEIVDINTECEFETVADADSYELFMKQKQYLKAYNKAIPGSKAAKTAKRLHDFNQYKSKKFQPLQPAKSVSKDALLKIILSSDAPPSLSRINSVIKDGADINAKDPETGVSVLMFAITNCNLEIASALIKAGANINASSNKGFTPLMNAALRKDTAFVKLLISAGANINAKTKDGTTALMSAAWLNKNPEILKTLILSGADTAIRCNNGCSAYDYAQLNKWVKNTSICQLLKPSNNKSVRR